MPNSGTGSISSYCLDRNSQLRCIFARTMPPKGAKLLPSCQDAQDLINAVQVGIIPRSYTAAKIFKLNTPLGSAISKYSTRSVNDLLNNYRKKKPLKSSKCTNG